MGCCCIARMGTCAYVTKSAGIHLAAMHHLAWSSKQADVQQHRAALGASNDDAGALQTSDGACCLTAAVYLACMHEDHLALGCRWLGHACHHTSYPQSSTEDAPHITPHLLYLFSFEPGVPPLADLMP